MPRKKATLESVEIPTFEHLNPDYAAKPLPEYQPPTRGSVRSRRASDMNPAWLMQEVLNRGDKSIDGWLSEFNENPTGYTARVNLGTRFTNPNWQWVSISHQEVEQGYMNA